MKKLYNEKEIMKIALLAGEIILENGGETYRVEETIQRICLSLGINTISAFVTPTGIFISSNTNENTNYIKRIRKRGMNLNKIMIANNISRDLTSNKIDYKTAHKQLENLYNKNLNYSEFNKYLNVGICSSFFCLLFKGGLNEFIFAFFISIISMIIFDKIESIGDTNFLSFIIAGSSISILSIITVLAFSEVQFDKIVVGSLMPFVPGVSLTNGIRDLISLDLVSGTSKIFEAIVIAISLAVGAGFVINFWIKIFGGGFII